MTALAVHVRASGPGRSFEQTFDRPPVFVGRSPASDLVLDSPGVSKTHACIDLRGGALCVRDCGSANGTLLAEQRLEPHRWTRPQADDGEAEVRISEWTLMLRRVSVAPSAQAPEATLRDFLRRPEATTVQRSAAPPPVEARTVVLSGARRSDAPAAPIDPSSLDEPYHEYLKSCESLRKAAARMLDAAPIEQRRTLCEAIAARCPAASGATPFAELLRSHGGSPPQAGSLARSALEQVQALARWYLGPGRSVVSEADVVAFKEHQRRALDELIFGFVKLVGGLERFEQEMALRMGGTAARSPEDLVRDLLDWSRPQDEALQWVRGGFADLMMHQVAMMHGVMRGVQALLAELAPAAIEAVARERRGRKLFGRLDVWSAYRERHADFSDEEGERFRVLFGPQFAEEYRALAREAHAAPQAPGAGQTVALQVDRRP